MEIEAGGAPERDERKALGWFVTYTPLELIEAAGLRPHRILGSVKIISQAGALLQGNVCSYALSALDCGLEGEYSFLSGIVVLNYCDATRRLYDAWVHYLKPPFAYMIDFPKAQTPGAERFFYHELVRLKRGLESHFGTSITDDKLEKSITLYNETRSLLKQLYEMRKQNIPPITGSQTIGLMKEVVTGDREKVNLKLRSLLADLKTTQGRAEDGAPRILLSGSLISDSRYVELIEECGAQVVCDDLCMGMKYFDMEVKRNGEEPLRALSEGYIRKMPSSLIMDADKRVDNLIRLAREYRVKGIIHQVLKFCNPHITDVPYFRKRLREANIPMLFVEREQGFESGGQLKTRIQAFLEIL
jgi:benzoyl-CoA reductase/2-hydroxyglutaryl-CoA dehydratase subunit BcrC/BadD/HgdB